MSDLPSLQARRASGVHAAAAPVGVRMSTTAICPPDRVAEIIVDNAVCQVGIKDRAYVAIAASNRW